MNLSYVLKHKKLIIFNFFKKKCKLNPKQDSENLNMYLAYSVGWMERWKCNIVKK